MKVAVIPIEASLPALSEYLTNELYNRLGTTKVRLSISAGDKDRARMAGLVTTAADAAEAGRGQDADIAIAGKFSAESNRLYVRVFDIKKSEMIASYSTEICTNDKTLRKLLSDKIATPQKTAATEPADKAAIERVEHGKDLYAEGKTDKAIAAFTHARAANSAASEALFYRGNAYYDKGEWGKAIADWSNELAVNPDHVWAYNNRGGAYLSIGEYDKAIKDCTKAIRLMPDFAKFYCNRGEVYLHKGEHDKAAEDFDKAITDFDKALELKPRLAEAYCYRGEAYSGNGEWDKAIADWEECLRIDPNNASAKANLDKARKEGKMKGTENQEGCMTDIEKKFEEEFDATTREYEKICGVVATRIHEMVARYGRRETAKRLMNNPDLQSGFKALRDAGRLDISSEALVIRYKKLFSPDAVEVAQWRLDHPYDLLEGK